MSSRSYERRTERATAEEVAEVERQLWEFAKRIDPQSVPEAKLRPGAFLWRVHKAWHSLGRGTGGLASRSFRALRDELLTRDPPVRNLQPKLYGNTPLDHAEAEQLIDVMLETWHLERGENGKWKAKPLTNPASTRAANRQDLETIRENLLHTLLRGGDQILLEEPVGLPPEVFMEERGRSSLALIIPTKSETTAHLSPSNLYGGFSTILSKFFDAAEGRYADDRSPPLLIWVLRLRSIRDNAEFHEAFHSLAAYSSCLTNWYFRLSQTHGDKREKADNYWKMLTKSGVFVIHGLPTWSTDKRAQKSDDIIDEDLLGIDPSFFLPTSLPIALRHHRLVRRHGGQEFGLNVSVESEGDVEHSTDTTLNYWLFPDRPKDDLEETADTTGLSVFNVEMSPGYDFDLAYNSVFDAVKFHLGLSKSKHSRMCFNTLSRMGWQIMTASQFQACLLASDHLGSRERNV